MSENKEIFENKIISWSKRFVNKLKNYELIEIIKSKNLSKINSENIKKFQNYGNWDFTPDFTIVIKNKNQKKEEELELILINREQKSLGLKPIGEIMCYNKVVKPLYSFLISEKGHSDEVSYFMINENFRSKLMNYNEKSLVIFSFNDNNDFVKEESIIPITYRKLIND